MEMEMIGATALRRPSSCRKAQYDVRAKYFLKQVRYKDGVEYWHARFLWIHL